MDIDALPMASSFIPGFGQISGAISLASMGASLIAKPVTSIVKSIGKIFKFAGGGLVTRPTLGLLGEAGPELVVPLSKLARLSKSGRRLPSRCSSAAGRAPGGGPCAAFCAPSGHRGRRGALLHRGHNSAGPRGGAHPEPEPPEEHGRAGRGAGAGASAHLRRRARGGRNGGERRFARGVFSGPPERGEAFRPARRLWPWAAELRRLREAGGGEACGLNNVLGFHS